MSTRRAGTDTRAEKQENAVTFSVSTRSEPALEITSLALASLGLAAGRAAGAGRGGGGMLAAAGPLRGKGSQALSSRRGTYLCAAVAAFCAVPLAKYVKVKQYAASEATWLCVKSYVPHL